MMKPTKVAIYARVSTADQNPAAQLRALREYAAQRGFEVYKEYIDYVSGSVEKRTTRRKVADKAYRELMNDVSRRAVGCVIVWKYDRFARSLSVLVSALQQFHALLSRGEACETVQDHGVAAVVLQPSGMELHREQVLR